MDVAISVIIPVYNAERFVKKAIISALQQQEVAEVIVVNDGSTDNSISIIKELAIKNEKVKVYHHANNKNLGRSASRNLGICKATYSILAFIDADDFYLENRFFNDVTLLTNDDTIDGVYNAIGVHFYRSFTEVEKRKLSLTTVKEIIPPNQLFEELLKGEKGYFSIDGFTVKKAVFDKVGFFNTRLNVSEDTEMFFRMALVCNLKTGIINTPVALRGVHETNIFNNEEQYRRNRIKMYKTLFIWTRNFKISTQKVDSILKILWLLRYKTENKIWKNIGYWWLLFSQNPKYMFSKLGLKYFPLVRLRQKLFPFLYN